MENSILYFILISSPLSVHIFNALKIFFLIVFSHFISNYLFSSLDDEVYTKKLLNYIKENSLFIQSKIVYDNKQYPSGIFFSIKKLYFGYIDNTNTEKNNRSRRDIKIYFYGKLPFKILNKTIIINSEDNYDISDNKIKLYLSEGYSDPCFKQVDVYYKEKPHIFQDVIINDIIKKYNKSKFNICRALICGDSNIGKSTIGKLLAGKLGGSLCFDIDLFSPGNSTLKLYEEVKPTNDNPLIIQIDEFDNLIDNVNEQKEPKKVEWLKNTIYNKATYNSFMSEYVTYLPNVIWLFTTNKNKQYFNNLDKSYINTNRIDCVKECFKEE